MNPSVVLQWVLGGWLAAVQIIVLHRLLSGRIRLAGVLTMDGRRFSPERLQLLALTLGGLLAYAREAWAAGQLPPIPESLFSTYAVSHALYLSGKAAGR